MSNGSAGSGNGSRTHEPSLRELTSDVDAVRELVLARIESLRELLNERDRLYSERDNSRRTAVDAALISAKELTNAAFTASEKAIVKAEDAQKEYNLRSNEFRGQLDDQAKRLISKTEVDSLVKNIEDRMQRQDADIRILREAQSEFLGIRSGSRGVKDEGRDITRLVINIAGLLLSIVLAAAAYIVGKTS